MGRPRSCAGDVPRERPVSEPPCDIGEVTYCVVLRRSDPQWGPARPVEEQSGWSAPATPVDDLVDAGSVGPGDPLADEHRVVLVEEAGSVETVRDTLGRDRWSGTHLLADPIDAWTIRRDGRDGTVAHAHLAG